MDIVSGNKSRDSLLGDRSIWSTPDPWRRSKKNQVRVISLAQNWEESQNGVGAEVSFLIYSPVQSSEVCLPAAQIQWVPFVVVVAVFPRVLVVSLET